MARPGNSRRGSTLLETTAALTLASTAAMATLSGLAPLACSVKVEAARRTLAGAMLTARRAAYAGASEVVVEAAAGASEVVVRPPGRTLPLGNGVTLTSVPADGDVAFHASGLADNATVRVSCGQATASVVVNQRGVVR